MKKLLFILFLVIGSHQILAQTYWNGSTTVQTTTSGDVGIGTTSPAAKTHIFTNNSIGSWKESLLLQSIGWVGSTDIFRITTANDAYSPGVTIFKVSNGLNYMQNKLQIGTLSASGPYTDWKLSVDGSIVAKRLVIQVDNWADYVFNPDYKLQPLAEVEAFIHQNQHLPGIPSEQEVLDNGADIGAMNVLLLKKVEELTLYMIELKKDNDALRDRVDQLEKK